MLALHNFGTSVLELDSRMSNVTELDNSLVVVVVVVTPLRMVIVELLEILTSTVTMEVMVQLVVMSN